MSNQSEPWGGQPEESLWPDRQTWALCTRKGRFFYKRDQLENNLLILGEQDSRMVLQWLEIGVC